MVDFNKLKTNSDLAKLAKKVEDQAKGQSFADERYWQPTKDKAGNGTAVFRLLPTPPSDLEIDDEAMPYVKYFDHSFKGPGGWYIEKCLTTLGKPDPCADYNNKLWNTEGPAKEANQKIARSQKRNLRYVTNILVVTDPGNPDCEGKVYLYRFGQKLFDKFQAAMKGDEDTVGYNPWSFDEGANFRIKVKQTKDKATNNSYPNYDDSKFLAREPLSDDQDELEAIWKKEYSLLAEVSADKFKSYADLQKQLNRALAVSDDSDAPSTPKAEQVVLAKEPVESTAETTTIPPWEEPGEVSGDSTLAMFEKLAQDV